MLKSIGEYRHVFMFLSRKRADFGIGTASVKAVAEKHGGSASFESEGTVFKASVYVRV